MLTPFLLIIFLGVLFIFGWQLARFILDEKRIEVIIPTAAISGSAIYVFLLNILSYFIKIQINFYLACLILIFFSYFLSRLNKKQGKAEWGIDRKWRKILFGACFFIMFFVGMMEIRAPDGMYLGHLPLTATIAEGNFPVHDPNIPDSPLQYHYAYNLFAAAIFKITHLPIWFTADFQIFIFTGVVFLFGFLLIKDFCKDNFKAFVASLIMILGGNLNFFYGIKGVFSLYQKYILHLPVETSFKFLSDIIFGAGVLAGLGVVINFLNSAWVLFGFALTTAVIYLYFRAINEEKNWLRISLLAGMLFSLLALSAEIFFGALGIILFIYPLIYAVLRKDLVRGKFYFKVSFLILFLGIIISFFQGGIVTQTVKQVFFGSHLPLNLNHFSVSPEYLLRGSILTLEGYNNVLVPIFSSTFFWGWGWLIIFIIPVAVYILRKYFQLGLFLILLILIPFFLPLIVIAGVGQDGFARMNLLTSLFWNLIFGLFLGWLLLFFKNKWQRFSVAVLILGVVFQGLWFLTIETIFPNIQMGRPFLGEPTKPNQAEFEALYWIRGHSTINDYFLTFEEEAKVVSENSKFVVFAGRFAPTFYYGQDVKLPYYFPDLEAAVPEVVLYRKILKECDRASLNALNYRYMYVNKNWPQGLEEKCLANNNLELKFQSQKGNQFARIYKVLSR